MIEIYKIWLNVDENGNITDSIGGYAKYIVDPEEEYDYFFVVEAEVFKNLGNYHVVNNELVEKTNRNES